MQGGKESWGSFSFYSEQWGNTAWRNGHVSKPWTWRGGAHSVRREHSTQTKAKARPQGQGHAWHAWETAEGSKRRGGGGRSEGAGRSEGGGDRSEGRGRSEGGGRRVRGRRQAKQTMRPFHSVVKTLPFNFPEMKYNEQSPGWIK